jgi:hypothetical protein
MEWIKQNDARFEHLTSKTWIMKQKWNHVLFLHWPISPVHLRPLVPGALQIDTYDGKAWLGMIIFEMGGIYPRRFPGLSLTLPFSEINVRTYVTYKGEPGIYFLSIDVNNWASLQIAKRWYHLPYHPAKVSIRKSGKSLSFEGIRKKEPLKVKGSYTPRRDVYMSRADQLDYWFTERYRLFSTDALSNLYTAAIDHPPWPLQQADVSFEKNTLFSPFPFKLAEDTPIAHYSHGVQTNFWNIKKLS